MVALFGCAGAYAADFTAGVIMQRMSAQERVTYINGVVDGLAYARYLRDGKKKAVGMKCIFDWYYPSTKDKDPILVILDAFDKYPDYPPAAIIEVLAEKACP